LAEDKLERREENAPRTRRAAGRQQKAVLDACNEEGANYADAEAEGVLAAALAEAAQLATRLPAIYPDTRRGACSVPPESSLERAKGDGP
jgi:hypothetical protein